VPAGAVSSRRNQQVYGQKYGPPNTANKAKDDADAWENDDDVDPNAVPKSQS
jgi:hypothetical protein